ncbi:hypothetical protein QT397_04060 [Microbulbifer sp. MKSA007]|nr:hypothetical protein QT397_04060 [Microbulbifer sp. MKSA007]
MKYLLLILIFLTICGCASQEPREILLPKIMNIEGKNFISANVFKEYELEINRPKGGEFTVNIPEKEAPNYYACGGVYWDESLYAQKILEEADLVLDFKGVKEVWVPIEGEPKKLYIFEVR